MMKKRAGLLLIAASVTAAVLGAACAPKDDTNNNNQGSPTPTVSQTATPTPIVSPTPTPLASDIVTAQNWITNDGKELWFRFETGFVGTIKNIGISTTPPSACSTIKTNVGIVATNFGFVTLVLSSAAGEVANCAVGIHHLDIDVFNSNKPGCTGTPCVNEELIFDSTATNVFFDDGVFGTVTAEQGNDSGNLRIKVDDPLATGRVVNLTNLKIYANNGDVLSQPANCDFVATLAPAAAPVPLEPCIGNPLTVAGNYKIYLRGKYADDGTDFGQYITFAYAP